MPRQTIPHRKNAPFTIEVAWARGKFAQLAVHCTDEPLASLAPRLEPGVTGIYADLRVEDITALQATLRRVKKQLLMEPAHLDATADQEV